MPKIKYIRFLVTIEIILIYSMQTLAEKDPSDSDVSSEDLAAELSRFAFDDEAFLSPDTLFQAQARKRKL